MALVDFLRLLPFRLRKAGQYFREYARSGKNERRSEPVVERERVLKVDDGEDQRDELAKRDDEGDS